MGLSLLWTLETHETQKDNCVLIILMRIRDPRGIIRLRESNGDS